MKTQPSASTKPEHKPEEDPTGVIILGILIPIGVILLLYLIYYFIKKNRDKSQSMPYQTKNSNLESEGQAALGIPKEDLKFIVPYYSASEMDPSRRCDSPVYPLPSSKHLRHQSAPAGPFLLHGKASDLAGKLGHRDSTPERSSSRPSADTHGICVQMYTSESDGDSTAMTDNEERANSKGKLCFAIELNMHQQQLKIHLKNALGLRSKSMKGSMHPAIRVTMCPDPKKTKLFTRAFNSTNPQLNVTFTFDIPQQSQPPDKTSDGNHTVEPFHDIENLVDHEIQLTLFHCDVFSRKTEVGFIRLKPFEMSQSSLPITHPIFQSGGMEIWRDFKCNDDLQESENPSRGQILISLSRDPEKKTVSVSVEKGKDIDTQLAGNDYPLLLVKLALVYGGKVLKSKRTKTLKRSQNPTFNETFRFHVKSSWLEKVSVIVSLCVKNVLGSSNTVGRVTLGPVMYAVGSGLDHWNYMISEPRSGVSQWHHIY